jgi:DNA-binding transcriptional ArsR family regulator
MKNICPLHRSVLSALLRLARRNQVAQMSALLDRVDASPDALGLALLELQHHGLVELRRDSGVRLLMPGFACAVAFAAERHELAHQQMARKRPARASSSAARAA